MALYILLAVAVSVELEKKNRVKRDLGLEQQVDVAENLPAGKSREVFHVVLRACSRQGC